MWIALRVGLVLSLISSLTACSTLYQGYSVKPLEMKDDSSYVKLTRALQGESPGKASDGTQEPPILPALIKAECFASSIPDALESSCTSQRNMAISALIIGSEDACLAHRRSMYGQEASWNISMGTLTSLFAGAASVVSAERSKSVLAALALFSNSERSLINETVYKQMLVTAVDKKIVETRDEKMRAIHTSLKDKNVNAYSVHEALTDVIALHNNCSFINGLEKALQEGSQDSSALKIARLRSNLLLLKSERQLEKDGASANAKGLDGRIEALHKALQVEELH